MKTMAIVRCILSRCSKYPKATCFLVATFVVALMRMHIEYYGMKTTVGNVLFSSAFPFPVPTYDAESSGRWHNFSTNTFRLYAYSAFLDDRPSLLSPPVIRVIAISDPYEEMLAKGYVEFYCVVYYELKMVVTSMNDQPRRIGLGRPLNRRMAREYIYTCPTVSGEFPLSVSIATERNQSLTPGVPVVVPNKPETKRDFCVCVQAVYGTLDPYRIIEWMELQKILGVSLVGVYILSAPDDVLKVFRHYSDENFVDLRKIDNINSSKTDVGDEFWLHLTPAINDCVYRHMYECKRILVIDFDEFIMPRKHQNLSELINNLDNSKFSAVNFMFRNTYFFLDLKADKTISKYLTFLKYRRRTLASEESIAAKSIINPQSCVNMHSQVCWSVTQYYNTRSLPLGLVEPSVALNQHYKKCHLNATQCRAMMKVIFDDDSVLRFEEPLTKRVTKKVKDIMGHGMYPDRRRPAAAGG